MILMLVANIVFVSCSFSAASPSDQTNTKIVTFAFHWIGGVGDKEYFVENGTRRLWYSALAACENAGLELATLDAPDQVAFLWSVDLGVDNYWTAGRDVHHDSRKFMWSPRPESPAYFPRYNILNAQPTNCLVLAAGLGFPLFGTRRCEDPSWFTLCQSRSENYLEKCMNYNQTYSRSLMRCVSLDDPPAVEVDLTTITPYFSFGGTPRNTCRKGKKFNPWVGECVLTL